MSVLWQRGGHRLWPTITLISLKEWISDTCIDGTYSQPQSQEIALQTVANSLEKLVTGNMEKRAIAPILDYTTDCIKIPITPNSCMYVC